MLPKLELPPSPKKKYTGVCIQGRKEFYGGCSVGTKYFAIGTRNLFLSQARSRPLESEMEDGWLGLYPVSFYYWSDLG